jgi:hypothetical protein
MAITALWRGRREEPESFTEISTDEFDKLLEDYDLLHVSEEPGRQFAVVAPRDQGTPEFGELGSANPSPWITFNRREYNPKLLGQKGLQEYDRMRKSDSTVRSSLRIFKSPVLSAAWFMEPGGTRAVDKRAAEFIWKNLTGDIMTISWSQILQEALLMCEFGYYMFEKVYENREIDGKPRTIWRKLAPRHPMDVESWVFDPRDCGPVGVWMYSNPPDVEEARRIDRLPGANATVNDPNYHSYPGITGAPAQNVSGIPNLMGYDGDAAMHPGCVFIPIEKLIVCTFDREAGNIEGTSVLRSAYKHWYFKEQLYKIDAIQKERHGIGIPVIKLPQGYKKEDKEAAEDLGRNIRTNERAHIVLPPGWDVAMLKLEGNPVDAMKSIEHHDRLIEKNVVGHFLNPDATGTSTDVLVNVFLQAVRYLADILSDAFNSYCIPQLTAYNFPNAKPPKLKHRHIGEAVDWRTMSFAIRNLIGANVIVPDDVLEQNIRGEMGLPKADPETARVIATPQGGANASRGGRQDGNTPNPPGVPKPPRVGPPRQTPVGQQRNTQGLPKPDAGNDKSGGK